MKSALIAALLLSTTAFAAPAQTPATTVQVLPDTETFAFNGSNGRRFQIYVARPSGEAPAGGWPVVYVLDANIMFGTMVDTVRAMQRRPIDRERRHVERQAIVIGIGYPPDLDAGKERARDLTASQGSTPNEMPNSGGAEAFIKVLADEIKPDIARRFKVDATQETIFGHSFGGHFVLYALVNRPDLFDNWIAASPSIWFEKGLLKKGNLRDRLAAKLETGGAQPRVLITVGEYEQAADPDFQAPKALPMLLARNQVENARDYAAWLAGLKGVESKFTVIAGEDHGTVIPGAIGRAVRFAFTPDSVPPARAPAHPAFVNTSRIKVPTAAEYLKLTPQQRYDMRIKVRNLPEAQRKGWTGEFQYRLSAALTYGEHRALHEERVKMDEANGTKPLPED